MKSNENDLQVKKKIFDISNFVYYISKMFFSVTDMKFYINILNIQQKIINILIFYKNNSSNILFDK